VARRVRSFAVTFEGQAAIWLEHFARGAEPCDLASMTVVDGELDWRPLVAALVAARARGADPRALARGFHRMLAQGLADAIRMSSDAHGVDTVVLSVQSEWWRWGGLSHNRGFVNRRSVGERAFIVPSIVPLNEPVLIEFTPAKSGDIAFSCGMNMLHGTIVVQAGDRTVPAIVPVSSQKQDLQSQTGAKSPDRRSERNGRICAENRRCLRGGTHSLCRGWCRGCLIHH
jgi:hypothetical protein